MTTLKEAREGYVADLKRRGKSLNTLLAAERTLAAFGNDPAGSTYRGKDILPLDILIPRDVERFLYRDPPLSAASFNRYRSVLHSFFDWCVEKEYRTTNPVRSIPAMKPAPATQHLILSPGEMLKMLEDANPVERIALALGMNTGLRASDIVSLTVGDVDLATGYISTTIQKTGGVDRKPITAELHAELNNWFAIYNTNRNYLTLAGVPSGFLPNDHLLVPSYTVTPQGKLQLRPAQRITHPHRIVQRAIAKLDLPVEGTGFHTLRRSSARALFEKLRKTENSDHALLVVREFLNHKSVQMTERYLGVNTERVIRDEALRGKNFLTPELVGIKSDFTWPFAEQGWA